jgi:hypothetical protein
MGQLDAWRMIRRRAVAAGIHAPIGNHTFRATGITAYLANGGVLEHAQEMAAHESPRTTKLYDRTKERLTQDEVERPGCEHMQYCCTGRAVRSWSNARSVELGAFARRQNSRRRFRIFFAAHAALENHM